MADAYKTLYQGQVPATVTTLGTVPSLKSWIIKSMTAVNTTSGAVTLKLYKNGTTAAYQMTNLTVPANGTAQWDGTEAMAAAEYIAGIAGSATSITLTISGDEVT